MTTIQYINTQEKLAKLCQQLQKEKWVALDTEFLREKSYYPQFCLLQLATPEWVACVDPLALNDLSSLFDILYQAQITKVFHACRQDLEIFYKITGKVPQSLFDTQIAAPLLGMQENPGYAMLVSSFLNINLSKAHTRTDWSIRPLSDEQLQYAADDVIYLCKIYQIICKQLESLGRLDWLEEDFKQLSKSELYEVHPEEAWLRIKGKNKLTGKQLSIVQSLSLWREQTAQQQNKPRNWLIRDDLLLELAKLQPTNLNALQDIRGINDRLVQRHGKTLCRLIAEAQQRLPIPLHDKGATPKKTQQQEAVLDVLNAVVRIRAMENSLNPAILASRKDLEKLLFNQENNLLLTGWRYSMVGRELQGLLKGEYALTLEKNSVKISVT